MKRKILTLALLTEDGRILLGMKKRGFGMGRWNGFGGKVHEGETIESGARRETEEECGITVTALEAVGIHEFSFVREPDEVLEVHVFRIDAYTGEPRETEEMKPAWFPVDAIPYDDMWPDDRLWIPTFLAGKKFRTRFLFGENDVVLEQDIQIVERV
ncbi:MAG: 8-oxo-dGTP diphosphatase [Undibacterium sp.]